MGEKLTYFLDVDTRARWLVILTSALCVAVFGFVSESSGLTVRKCQVAGSVLGCIVFGVQVLLYVLPGHAFARRLQLDARMYVFRSAIAVAASAILATVASVSAPIVQAAILNRRLQDVLTNPSKQSADDAHAVITYALQSGVQLRADLVAAALKDFPNMPSDWEAYVAAFNYAAISKGIGGSPRDTPPRIRELESRTKNVPACGPGNEGHSLFGFMTKDGRVTSVENLAPWPIMISRCRLQLDGKTIKNTIVDYAVVEYNGGSLTLDNVRFGIDRFVLEQDNPNVRIFMRALLHSDNNVITLHIE